MHHLVGTFTHKLDNATNVRTVAVVVRMLGGFDLILNILRQMMNIHLLNARTWFAFGILHDVLPSIETLAFALHFFYLLWVDVLVQCVFYGTLDFKCVFWQMPVVF